MSDSPHAPECVGLEGGERAVAVEAALIVLALKAYRKGAPAGTHAQPALSGTDAVDLTGEASWLVRIAEAMPAALKLQRQVHV